MKKIVRIVFLAALMIGAGSVTKAQNFHQSAFINLGLPTGDFNSKVRENHTIPLTHKDMGKNAGFGFGLGYRASYSIPITGVGEVSPFAQVDVFWNTLGSSLKSEYTQARASHTPFYLNFPVQLGVNFRYTELWNDIEPFGEFGFGADFFMMGSEGPCTQTISGITNTTPKYAYKMTTTVAFSLGLGSYFGRYFSAGIYYYGMGTHNIEYTGKTLKNLGTAEKLDYESGNVETRSIGTLALRIGFHF